MPLIVLLAIPVTLGRLIALTVLVPEVVLPVKETFKPLVVVVPDEELLVKANDAKLSLLFEVVKASDNLTEEELDFPGLKLNLYLRQW